MKKVLCGSARRRHPLSERWKHCDTGQACQEQDAGRCDARRGERAIAGAGSGEKEEEEEEEFIENRTRARREQEEESNLIKADA